MLMPLRVSCAALLSSASCSCVRLLRSWMARLTRNTPSSRNGYGRTAATVSQGSRSVMTVSPDEYRSATFRTFSIPGPKSDRMSIRSLTARDMISPVRCRA